MSDFVKKYKHPVSKQYVYVFRCGLCKTEFNSPISTPLIQCPNDNCGLNINYPKIANHWFKPETEVKLFILQEQLWKKIDIDLFKKFAIEMKKPDELDRDPEVLKAHLKNIDTSTKDQLFFVIKDYVGSLLKKKIKNSNFYLAPDDFEEKVYQATFNWFNQYMSSPYKIDGSWAGQLNWKIIEALYRYKDERFDSLDRMVANHGDSHGTEFMDMVEIFNIKPLFTKNDKMYYDPYEDNHGLVDELNLVINRIVGTIRKTQDMSSEILVLISFLFFIQQKEKKIQLIYSNYGIQHKKNLKRLNVIMRRYLRNISKN